jgi:phospholipase/carboxylesterase
MEYVNPALEPSLPARLGARPRTHMALPHMQLDQWPPAEIAQQLVDLALSIPGVRAIQSRMAFPTSLALCLKDDLACGPPEAFIDNHEFCLLHSLPQASVHLTLPREVRDRVVQLGWAERHPGVQTSIIPQTVVMLYAPRDSSELRVVFDLICMSSRFAKGALSRSPRDTRSDGVLSWAG